MPPANEVKAGMKGSVPYALVAVIESDFRPEFGYQYNFRSKE